MEPVFCYISLLCLMQSGSGLGTKDISLNNKEACWISALSNLQVFF